eukprot:550944-Rhodomonas_salina.1
MCARADPACARSPSQYRPTTTLTSSASRGQLPPPLPPLLLSAPHCPALTRRTAHGSADPAAGREGGVRYSDGCISGVGVASAQLVGDWRVGVGGGRDRQKKMLFTSQLRRIYGGHSRSEREGRAKGARESER